MDCKEGWVPKIDAFGIVFLEKTLERVTWTAKMSNQSILKEISPVTKSWTQLSDFTFTFNFHALEKEMTTHSSVLAWRIPGMGEPGGLLSVGSHRARHNWGNLAAAAAFIGRTDTLAETPILWPHNGRTGSLEKILMLGKIEVRRRMGMTEDEMV